MNFMGDRPDAHCASSLDRPEAAEQTILSDRLAAAWSSFARTGNPNGAGDQPWPRYTAGAGASWLIQNTSGLSTLTDAQYSALRHCDFWESLITTN
jgi:para-nitrobenzyl esterase